jgi:proteasome lid subunit RPN8/RPN11
MSLRIPAPLLETIKRHAEAHYPEEGAGLILGYGGQEPRLAVQLRPLRNSFAPDSRHNRYMIDPWAMMEADQEAESMGLDVIGVFHSHPDHPAQPSEYDRQWAMPWYVYLITSVHQGKAGETRAWLLNDDHQAFTQETLLDGRSILDQEAP